MKEFVLKKVGLLRSDVLLTARRYTMKDVKSSGGVIHAGNLNALYPVQEVVAVSRHAESVGIEVGQQVVVNFARFAREVLREDPNSLKRDMDEVYKKKIVYELPLYDVDNREHLLVDVMDILFIAREVEEVEESDLPPAPAVPLFTPGLA